jgi:hypothetical protein
MTQNKTTADNEETHKGSKGEKKAAYVKTALENSFMSWPGCMEHMWFLMAVEVMAP